SDGDQCVGYIASAFLPTGGVRGSAHGSGRCAARRLRAPHRLASAWIPLRRWRDARRRYACVAPVADARLGPPAWGVVVRPAFVRFVVRRGLALGGLPVAFPEPVENCAEAGLLRIVDAPFVDDGAPAGGRASVNGHIARPGGARGVPRRRP